MYQVKYKFEEFTAGIIHFYIWETGMIYIWETGMSDTDYLIK